MPMADLASPASDQGVKMAADDSGPNLYKELMNRFLNLEASHSKLREEVEELLQEKRNNEVATSDSGESTSDSVHGFIPGFFSDGSPFRSILESVGHAVHVCSASSGEITCWNRAAENLYGWRDYEVLGQRAVELLVVEEYQNSVENITKHLASGKSWSGQIPVRRKCGDILLAMVTKSALYEHNELAGIITVSSDAAIFNSIASENLRSTYQDCGRVRGSNSKRIQWHPPLPQIGPVPQIASSVSNLASKLLHRRNGDDTYNPCSSSRGEKDATNAEDLKPEKYSATDAPNPHNGKWTSEGRSSWKDESAAINFVKPSKIADKVLAKLKIKGGSNFGNEADGSIHQNGASHASVSNEKSNKPNSSGDLKESVSGRYPVVSEKKERSDSKKEFNFTAKSASERRLANSSEESCALASLREEGQIFPALPRGRESLARSECQGPNEIERDGKQFSSGESIASHGSSSSKGDNESNLAGSCEICWEDLVLGEEIGQGSYAVVYRGFWNGSEVAVKVYIGNEYNEETLQNYQKETEIMKKLRHPNVLLFMGAVFSQKRLAMVTEFLPRGSLFKTLHKNNQSLDIRRRLRMALDVAKGMNYLHRRNPPIVHRDLKSSNLLVDRNWTVKVGDFGLSKWKDATYLTTKSGRGTPQWMAPEVLRNEPSNEKSDVFSFGVILWELVTASIPWKNLNPLEVVGVVGFMDRRLEVPERVNPRVASIIRDCWHSDPSRRPSFEEIIRRLSGLFQKANTVPKSPDGLQCNGDKLQD